MPTLLRPRHPIDSSRTNVVCFRINKTRKKRQSAGGLDGGSLTRGTVISPHPVAESQAAASGVRPARLAAVGLAPCASSTSTTSMRLVGCSGTQLQYSPRVSPVHFSPSGKWVHSTPLGVKRTRPTRPAPRTSVALPTCWRRGHMITWVMAMSRGEEPSRSR